MRVGRRQAERWSGSRRRNAVGPTMCWQSMLQSESNVCDDAARKWSSVHLLQPKVIHQQVSLYQGQAAAAHQDHCQTRVSRRGELGGVLLPLVIAHAFVGIEQVCL